MQVSRLAFYEEYKPLRNTMRRFALLDGLVDVWGYALHVIHGQPLRAGLAVGIPLQIGGHIGDYLYPWDLDVMARELLINAGARGTLRLGRWSDLAKVSKMVRRLDGLSSQQPDTPDVLFEIHRIVHRQFPWQRSPTVDSTVRYLKVFGASNLEEIVLRELGMSMKQLFLLGGAVTGNFMRDWGMSTNQDYAVLGIGIKQSQAFFDRLAATPAQLKASLDTKATYGTDWLYAWNPLERWPLIRFDPAHPDRVICPIPAYLQRRVMSGVFYDLVNSKDFKNPYGTAFESYIGEVTTMVCLPPRFRLIKDEPYFVKLQEQRGVDWVLGDETAELAIECKAKRLRLEAKLMSDTAALSAELDEMAKAIVQLYRNIREAQADKAPWKPNGSPIYPIVLTFEEWFLFSPFVQNMLGEHVRRRLENLHIPISVLDEMPYTVASAHEYEVAIQVIAQIGIQNLLSKKTQSEFRHWSLMPFMTTHFPTELSSCHRRLFMEDLQAIMAEVQKA